MQLALLFSACSAVRQYSVRRSQQLRGTVYDSTRAVVPRASVVISGATVERTVVTDENGFYRAVALPAGRTQVPWLTRGSLRRRLRALACFWIRPSRWMSF